MWVISLVAVITGAGSETELAIFPILFGFTVLCLVIGIPVAYLVAIFRHGLWDLDVVIRKTVRYAVVVIAFMVLGLLLVTAVPTLLFGVGGSTDVLPTLLLAGVMAGAFLWLRPRAARLRGPARVRPASHPVRGTVGVQRASRRHLLHRRRTPAHGTAGRRRDRGAPGRRVVVRCGEAASGEPVAGRRRTTCSHRSTRMRSRPPTASI